MTRPPGCRLSTRIVTDNARSDGMRARPVIGGVFIKMLDRSGHLEEMGEPRHGEGRRLGAGTAPPRITEIVPTSRAQAGRLALYVQEAGRDWAGPGFDDSEWKQGPGGFGTKGTPGAVIGTTWNTPDIWLRRESDLPAGERSVANRSSASITTRMSRFTSTACWRPSQSGYATSYQLSRCAQRPSSG